MADPEEQIESALETKRNVLEGCPPTVKRARFAERVQTFAIVATKLSVFFHIFAVMLVKPHLAASCEQAVVSLQSILILSSQSWQRQKKKLLLLSLDPTLSSLSGNNNNTPAPVSHLSPAYSQIITALTELFPHFATSDVSKLIQPKAASQT